MPRRILFKDLDDTEYAIDIPLTCNIDLNEIKTSLGVPAFLNTESFVMERALVVICGATIAHKLHDLYPNSINKDLGTGPIPALLFGGVAVRMHSPSSNDPTNPFFRKPNDIDIIVPRKRAIDLVHLLTGLGEIYGTRYYHFLTATDRMFNARRGGYRYRMRTIEEIMEDGTPIPGVLDILVDSVDLRHKVDVGEDFKKPNQNMYTISLPNIVLTKCQFIFDLPKPSIPQIIDAGLEYRVLNYPYLKSERIVLGMEEKDIKDVCALLADNPVGDVPGSISTAVIRHVLQHDKKFALTFRLNLQNIVEKPQILESLKIGGSTMSRIQEGITEILKVIPTVENKWNTPWWNVDVETPEIFGKVKGQ